MNETSQAVYGYIIRYVEQHGFPPTVREIGAACFLASTSAVHYQLSKLEAEGRLTREPRSARNIRLVEGWTGH
jgi:repressor LexA